MVKDHIMVSTKAVTITVALPENSFPYISNLGPPSAPSRTREYSVVTYPPLVEIRINGQGNSGPKTGASLIGSAVSQRLRYSSYRMVDKDGDKHLDIGMHDEQSGLTATAHIILFADTPVARFRATVRNDSTDDLIVQQVSSLAIGGVSNTDQWWLDYNLSTANNSWFREAQWVKHDLPSLGLDDCFSGLQPVDDPPKQSMAYHSLTGRSTFSTRGNLPMGMVHNERDPDIWLWQVENNGAWRSEIGDCGKSLYIATTGPEASDHDWRISLGPSETYTTCWTGITHLQQPNTVDDAFAALTKYRRSIIRPHPDHSNMPIIFNDYMNCLMGDPTEEKILALLEPVAKSGAEYFVIDAGWYAENEGWWDEVGEWEPSPKRFPSGFKQLLDQIRGRGLTPGLWIEPEVIGVRSPLAQTLPAEMFLQRNGVRAVEQGRYHLDFRHPDTRARMDQVIDRLVLEYGVGYFKFDYNIEHVLGTDLDCFSAGQGQEGHSRAYLAWVNGLLDRHEGLVIENCSSGGQRMDYGMLETHTLQSTSDQQDPVHYAAISASIPTAIIPEQSASWAYPQKEWSDEINALTVANSLLGRIHLSGRLDALSPHQLDLVYEGMAVYKQIRQDLRTATPFWPLGLPSWRDHWLALGMRCDEKKTAYITVWRRGGQPTCVLPIDFLVDNSNVRVELLYPVRLGAQISWKESAGVEVSVNTGICARLLRLDYD